jgi:hypothetical protein
MREVSYIDSNKNTEFDSKMSTLTVIPFKLPFVPGSNDSMGFLTHLCSLNDSEIFGTTMIKRILDYKWLQVKIIGYFLTIMYVLYLICLTAVMEQTWTEPWHFIAGWAGYFTLIEIF